MHSRVNDNLWASTNHDNEPPHRHAKFIKFTVMLTASLGGQQTQSRGFQLLILTNSLDQNLHIKDCNSSKRRESTPKKGYKVDDTEATNIHTILSQTDGWVLSTSFASSADSRQPPLHLLYQKFIPSFPAIVEFVCVRAVSIPSGMRGATLRSRQYISILPTRQDARPIPPRLPTPAVLQVTLALAQLHSHSDGGIPWSSVKCIVACSRTAKAWLPVLDILWAHPLGILEDRIPIKNIHQLAQCLRYDHILRRKICTLVFSWVISWDENRNQDWILAQGNIALGMMINHCRNLVRVELSTDQTHKFRDRLKALKRVERLRVFRDPWFIQTPLGLFHLFTTMQGWVALERLEVGYWASLGPQPSFNLGESAPYSLKTLNLEKGTISKAQLLYLVSNPYRQLRSVSLNHLKGLTNQSFEAFLSIASDTIENLEVLECSLVSPISRDEERALDSTIRFMTKLRNVHLQSTLMSVKSIPSKAPLSGTSRLSIKFSNISDALSFLGVSSDDDLEENGSARLLAAVEVTEWSHISFIEENFWKSRGWKREMKLITLLRDMTQLAQRLGEQRGVIVIPFQG